VDKVYLAANWPRKDEIRGYVHLFKSYGITVQARWLYEKAPANTTLAEVDTQYLEKSARDDLEDIIESDAVILFSNGYGSRNVGGGRLFEAGFAHALNKPIITIGEPEMIFQKMPESELVYTVTDVHAALSLILTWQNELYQAKFRAEARQDNIDLVKRINDEGGQKYALDYGDSTWGGI
jgi:nucleoside 2-deoxyribosyltransferase